MNFLVTIRFAFLIHFLAIINGEIEEPFIYMFTEKNFAGRLKYGIQIDECIPLKHGLANNVSSIKTRNHCARLYSSKNCEGDSIEILPRSPFQYDLARWGFDNRAQSVGPCRNPCGEAVTGFPCLDKRRKTDHDTATVFDEKDFKGNHITMPLHGCTLIPRNFTHKILSVSTNLRCIQLYNNDECLHEGSLVDSIELRKDSGNVAGTPLMNDVSAWFFDAVVAVSNCCYKCVLKASQDKVRRGNAPKSNSKEGEDEKAQKSDSDGATKLTAENANEPYVHLYSEYDHGGPTVNVIRIKACNNLLVKYANNVSSINTRGHCARLYRSRNCQGDSIEVLSRSPAHNDLRKWDFDKKAQSVGPCRNSCGFEVTGRHCLDERSRLLPDTLTIFNEKDFKGNQTTINIHGCTLIPRNFTHQVLSAFTPSRCLQFYNNDKCLSSGKYIDSIELRRADESNQIAASPLMNDIAAWHFKEVIAVSNCCHKCIKNSPIFNISGGVINEPSVNGGKSSPNKKEEASYVKTILITTVATIISLSLIIFVILTIRKRIIFKNLMNMMEKEITEFFNGYGLELNEENSQVADYSLELLAQNRPYNPNASYEIPRSNIEIDTKSILGMGEFGIVFKGQWTKVVQNEGGGEISVSKLPVAVKTVRPDASIKSLKSLLKEAKVLLYVGAHNNIVQVVGCCTENLRTEAEVLVVVEFCANGSLEKFLEKNRDKYTNLVVRGQLDPNLFQKDAFNEIEIGQTENTISSFNIFHIFRWMIEIAKGMEYLASRKVIHGDLAARNVLLDENFTPKVSDFGLSKQLYCDSEYRMKRQELLSWRWLAIESLKHLEFSTKSDIWSYGVLCWEMLTLGEKPFQGDSYNTDFIRNLEEGMRLQKPSYALTENYSLLKRCWDYSPRLRPDFHQIRVELEDIIDSARACCLSPGLQRNTATNALYGLQSE